MNIMELIHSYTPSKGWDEMKGVNGIREEYLNFLDSIKNLNLQDLEFKQQVSSELFMNQGITFTVYSDNEGTEKIFPFDILPRIINHSEWEMIDAGIKQRLKALNIFLKDIYSTQSIIKDGIIPAKTIANSPGFCLQAMGISVANDIYSHIAGIDLIKGENGEWYVLEDNLRTPSGVSYMLENREITKRLFPESFNSNKVLKVNNYPILLYNNLCSLSPRPISNPVVVILSPGIYNSAYFEHTFLARQMGVDLVEGRDLVVDNDIVYMKTISGLSRIDVIYRRIDDEYLDPLSFNPNSILGVPGILNAYRKGNVAIVNAIGNGIADDKAIYHFVPQMIDYYLNEKPILNNVPTYFMNNPEHFSFLKENIQNMVVKRTNQSGGYGMLMGNASSDKEIDLYLKQIEKSPDEFVAQPIIQLSTVPCFIDGKLVARHVDFRPFAIYGKDEITIIPGGLTRVALKEGSLVVNSSQGGGSKDTWII